VSGSEEDIKKGWTQFSTDLVFEIGLEIRDVFPEVEDILYAFIDAPSRIPERSCCGNCSLPWVSLPTFKRDS